MQVRVTGLMELEARPILEDVTVLIGTIGRPILEESLYHIAAGTAWPASLIVVDQSSSPEVTSWLEQLQRIGLQTDYVPSSQRGKAAALNRGIERVRTRFLAVTDDDCFVAPDWLENLTSGLRENPDSIITGRVEGGGSEAVVAVMTSRTSAIYRRPRLKHDSMSGGNMGTSMAAIQRIGFFDEDPCVRYAEDCEWSYRALRSRVPIKYDPDVLVTHFGWRDEGERSLRYDSYALSMGGFYGKYLRRGDWFIALRVIIQTLRSLRRWARGAVTRDHESARHGRAFTLGLLPGIFAGWRSGGRS